MTSVIPAKRASDYLADLQDNVTDQTTLAVDTTSGAVVDVFLGPASVIAEVGNTDLRQVEGLLTLDNPEAYTAAELAGSLARDGVSIAENVRASGYVVFYRAADVGAVTPDTVQRGFPIGTAPDSTGYATTAYTTETRAWTSAVRVPGRSRWELSVPVTITAAGARGNVAPSRLTRPLRTLPNGYDGVTNLEKLGNGTDSETNTRAAGRAALAVRGAQKSTPSGIKKLLLDQLSDITSIRVVYGSGERLIRAESTANAVDVWVKTTATATVTESVIYSGLGTLHVLSQQPVVSVSTVTIGGTGYDEDTEWELTADTGLEYGSIRGQDGITVLGAASPAPTVGATMVVTYSVATTVRSAQAAINTDAVEALGADVLVRAATAVPFYVAARMRPLTGNSFNVVEPLVRAAILELVNNQRALDDAIEVFDINAAVDDDDISGVDNFVLDRLAISAVDTTAADRDLDVNEYAELLDANLVITQMS